MTDRTRLYRLEATFGDPGVPTARECFEALHRMVTRMRFYTIDILTSRGVLPPPGFDWAEPTEEERGWFTFEGQGLDMDIIERYERATTTRPGWGAADRLYERFSGTNGVRERRAMLVPPWRPDVPEPQVPEEWSPFRVVRNLSKG